MQTLYSILFWLTSLIAILFTGSTILAFTKSSHVLPKEKGAFVFIALIFIGVVLGAFYLKKQDKIATANLLMGVLWGLILVLTIWAIGKARWN